MEKLRSEIRSAFEKEQAVHPPIAALRRNVVEAVTARRRPARNFQWVAVAAALVLGILVVVGLMSTRLAHRATAPVTNPKASPVADYGPPPAGVPLLYVHDPNNPTWLIGFDWTANPRGTVKPTLPAGTNAGWIRMSPDGQQFQVVSGGKGDSGTYLDRLGKPLPEATPPGIGGMWADDNRHLCTVQLDQTAFTWTLVTQLPGEAKRSVAVIARDQGIGQTGISLASCSFRNDQAIAVRTSIWWPSELWVMRLSDGKVLSHRTYQPVDLATVVASPDGVYVAENSAKSAGAVSPQGAAKTVIRRVSDWTVVSTLESAVQVLGFSAEDSLVLVNKSPMARGASHLEVTDWQVQHGVWNYDGPEVFGTFVAQAKGFAIGLKANNDDPLRDVVIVHSGNETLVLGRYLLAW